jgi:AraC-like DNA-binding protein
VVKARESFARWHIPPEIDGLALRGGFAHGPGRSGFENRHDHAELELHLVTRGRGAFLLGDSRLDAARGTLLWVPPRCEHTVLDPSLDFERWMLLLRPRLARRVLPPEAVRRLLAVDLGSRPSLARTLAPHQTVALTAQFADAQRAGRQHHRLHNATMAYLLARAFAAFAASDDPPAWSVLHPAVAEAVRLLRAPSEPPSRAALARRCGLSEWHLSKLFHQQIGVSLVEFRNRCRLERFLELYGDGTNAKMTSAALDAGFGSYAQFHRVFRARLGHAPAEHARRVRRT